MGGSGVSTFPARVKLSNLDSSYLKLSEARAKFARMMPGSVGGMTEDHFISQWNKCKSSHEGDHRGDSPAALSYGRPIRKLCSGAFHRCGRCRPH